MSKKIFDWMLMAALMCSLSFTVTSCKDDDDEKSEEKKEQEARQKADNFWDVVGQLTSMDNYTADYADKTFEPTIGEPSEGNPYVRIVATNDVATAATRFAALVGVKSIDETTPSYDWKDDNIGTMSYRKSTDGQSLATVDVNIKQLPRLQQIVYKTPDQMGTNGKFSGTAYYRFGDVVKRTYKDKNDGNKQKVEYWICVRPAFGPEGKEKSHWVSVSPPPAKNIWEYDASNGNHYALPTGIGKNEEQMQNFAEMLYAIVSPDMWEKNIGDWPKLKVFHDFHRDSIKYHNQYFWTRVDKAWKKNNIWNTVFGMTRDKMRENIVSSGVFLLYKGYSWWTKVSWNATLYAVRYSAQFNKNANMHDVTFEDYEVNMRNYADFDITKKYTMEHPYFLDDVQEATIGMNRGPHFIIRHATGKELCGGTDPGPLNSMAGNETGIEDFYTYNKAYGITPGRFTTPEVAQASGRLETPRVGCLVGTDGKFYSDKSAMDELKVQPVAMVVYYNPNGKVELGKDWKGLAMALEDKTEGLNGYAWSDIDSTPGTCSVAASPQHYAGELMGYHMTEILATHRCNKDHRHPAAEATYAPAPAPGFSEWFLPSAGQWILAMEGLGYTWDKDAYKFTGDGSWPWEAAGIPDAELTKRLSYWTTTETLEEGATPSQALSFGVTGLYFNFSKITRLNVRPFTAF